MVIRYVELYQTAAIAKKDLLVVCTEFQICGVIPSSSRGKGGFVVCNKYVGLCQAVAAAKTDLVVVCNGYQVCGVIPAVAASKKDLLRPYQS